MENSEKNLSWEETSINHYQAFFVSTKADQRNCKVSIACLNPGICIEEILSEKPHNILLTSGTLTPFESYESDFGIPFDVKFNCDHIINKDKQIWAGIVSGLHQNMKLNFSYANRSNSSMKVELGRNILN